MNREIRRAVKSNRKTGKCSVMRDGTLIHTRFVPRFINASEVPHSDVGKAVEAGLIIKIKKKRR